MDWVNIRDCIQGCMGHLHGIKETISDMLNFC